METGLLKADNHLHPFEYHPSKNGMRRYAKRAQESGFKIITFTEHCPLPAGFGKHGMTEAELEEYITSALELREEFTSMQIMLGLEVDYHPEIMDYMERMINIYSFDFIIGSIHMHTPGYTQLIKGKSFDRIVIEALELTQQAVLSGLFDSIAHLDFFRQLIDPVCFGQFTGTYRPEKHRDRIMNLLALLEKKQICLDVNSSGLRKSFSQIMPCPEILKWAADFELTYSFGSDAHDVRYVGAGYKEVMTLLSPGQQNSLVYYCRRKPVPLSQFPIRDKA